MQPTDTTTAPALPLSNNLPPNYTYPRAKNDKASLPMTLPPGLRRRHHIFDEMFDAKGKPNVPVWLAPVQDTNDHVTWTRDRIVSFLKQKLEAGYPAVSSLELYGVVIWSTLERINQELGQVQKDEGIDEVVPVVPLAMLLNMAEFASMASSGIADPDNASIFRLLGMPIKPLLDKVDIPDELPETSVKGEDGLSIVLPAVALRGPLPARGEPGA